jgi:hypothetical protein
MFLSIPCSPSPHHLLLIVKVLFPFPQSIFGCGAVQTRLSRIFPTSLDGRYGLDFVNVGQTSEIPRMLRLYFCSVWLLAGYYYYQGSFSGTSTGLCRITPGDPAPAIACHSTIVSSHRAGCSIRAKLLLPPGALWLSSHSSFFPLISLLLTPFFFAPFYRALSALKGPDSELRLRLIHRMISSQLISLT